MTSMKDAIITSFRRHLTLSLGKRPDKSSDLDRYQALALSVRDLIMERWIATRDAYEEEQPRTVNYISLEFLMGRTLGNAMINLDVYDAVEAAMKELGFKLSALRDEEVDAGLGNGGLGRLAACFMDSLSTLDYPAMGFSICYEYGLFKQKIIDGNQVEVKIPKKNEDNKKSFFFLKCRDFCDAILNNGASPIPWQEIIYNQAIIDGIFKSNESGHEVEINIPEI